MSKVKNKKLGEQLVRDILVRIGCKRGVIYPQDMAQRISDRIEAMPKAEMRKGLDIFEDEIKMFEKAAA